MISQEMDSEVQQVHCRMNLQLPGALRKKMAEVHPAIGAEEVDPEGLWHCAETFAKQR